MKGMARGKSKLKIGTKNELIALIGECRSAIRGLGVKRIGVFGSFAKNEPQSESDIDLLVEFAPGKKTFDNFMELVYLIEDRAGREADLVTLEGMSPHIGPRILKEVEFIAL
ncbi:MAG: nucleotidyltransferase family protein [Spirochaetia bacterium]|jgi:predicted nucleotidyltransferase